jgi:DNA-binding CsgD family transcriptional regulator
LNQKERLIIVGVLALISVMVGVDLISDYRASQFTWHIFVEGVIGLAAAFGVFYILRGSYNLKHRLDQEILDYSEFKKEAEAWRAESKKYLEGLSTAIDQQLSRWNLSPAEKEVAFLLLKGLSLKEVASIRNTSEKTARVQSIAIYSKSGLAGRSELSAFFLEDLLAPHLEKDKFTKENRP